MENKSPENNGEQELRIRAKYVITDWTQEQITAAALAANKAGYDVDYETVEDDKIAMVLYGEGNYMTFTSTMLAILNSDNFLPVKSKTGRKSAGQTCR